MSRIGLLQLRSGIAGDMLLGALLDAGAPLPALQEAVRKVAGDAVSLRAEPVLRAGIRGIRVEVLVAGERLEEPGGPRPLGALGGAGDAAARIHHHAHRAYRDIVRLLTDAPLASGVRSRALDSFAALARAEAGLHGTSPEEVHFHEVGSWDAIADVVGAAAGLEALGVETLYHGPVAVGGGSVAAAHGELPVPAPATLALLAGRPCVFEEDRGELTTPTGAALVAALAAPSPPGLRLVPRASGYGAGRADPPDRPNLTRLVLGDPGEGGGLCRAQVAVAECALDDAPPEEAGHLMERLFAAGALDVAFSPLVMKKGRPGFLLRLVAPAEAGERFARILLTESTTLGVRWRLEERLELERRIDRVRVAEREVKVKVAVLPDGTERPHPEFEDLSALAREEGLPLGEARRRVEAAWRGGS